MKSKERKALDLACLWLEQSGACKHYNGYICNKEVSKDGVCAKCLVQHFLKMAEDRHEGVNE